MLRLKEHKRRESREAEKPSGEAKKQGKQRSKEAGSPKVEKQKNKKQGNKNPRKNAKTSEQKISK